MSDLSHDWITGQIALVDLIHEAVIVRDLADKIQFWNRGAESLYGWSKARALGRDLHELLRNSFPCSLERTQRDLSEAGHWEGELRQMTRDLNADIVSSRWVLCTEHGGESDVREVSTDITAQRKIEADLRHINLELASERHATKETLQAVRESLAATLEQAEVTRTVVIRRFGHDLNDHSGQSLASFNCWKTADTANLTHDKQMH